MSNSFSKILYLLIPFLFYTHSIYSQDTISETVRKTLKVGVVGSEPFVFEGYNEGIAIEIWEEIADKEGWKYDYVPYASVDEALHTINKGDVDLVIGPISITSKRLENTRFSQPFYNSSISIISRVENKSFWQKLKPLFSLKLLIAVGIFLIILGIVGAFLWLAERKASPDQFPHDAVKGIGTGMWLAVVTMSTTGYGDIAPRTLTGRIIAGSWMVISIIFATSMVAGIASTLTLSSLGNTTISNIEQLSGVKAATVSGSPSDEFLNKSKVTTVGMNSLADAIDKLKKKEVDAVVYDRPQLLYYLKNHKDDNLYISKAEYYKQGYGFAFPFDSKLISDVNQTLLELAENQEINKIIHHYIEKDE